MDEAVPRRAARRRARFILRGSPGSSPRSHPQDEGRLGKTVHSLLSADQGQKRCQFRAVIKARKRQAQRHEKLFALAVHCQFQGLGPGLPGGGIPRFRGKRLRRLAYKIAVFSGHNRSDLASNNFMPCFCIPEAFQDCRGPPARTLRCHNPACLSLPPTAAYAGAWR